MTKTDSLRRILLPCFYHSPTAAPTTPTATATATTNTIIKKRLSISLRDNIEDPPEFLISSTCTSPQTNSNVVIAPPRPSRIMVIGTIFGTRRGHVFFCFQHDRLSTKKPLLFLEFSIPTHQLVKEMQCGFVRIALESSTSGSVSCRLRSVPVWSVSFNGKKIGFALKRKVNEYHRMMLKTMESMTVGAGVIPAWFGSGGAEEEKEEVIYMRAHYEHVVGSANSEAFHLINLDECSDQELSVFLIRST